MRNLGKAGTREYRSAARAKAVGGQWLRALLLNIPPESIKDIYSRLSPNERGEPGVCMAEQGMPEAGIVEQGRPGVGTLDRSELGIGVVQLLTGERGMKTEAVG